LSFLAVMKFWCNRCVTQFREWAILPFQAQKLLICIEN
jgi:hypothetical protein